MRPLPRCCASHDNWSTLGHHLAGDFTDLDPDTVLARLVRAACAVRQFGIAADEQLEMAEVVVRYELSLMTGRIDEVARLDPQTHPKRGRTRRSDFAMA